MEKEKRFRDLNGLHVTILLSMGFRCHLIILNVFALILLLLFEE